MVIEPGSVNLTSQIGTFLFLHLPIISPEYLLPISLIVNEFLIEQFELKLKTI